MSVTPIQVYLPGGGPQWAQVKTIAVAASAAACSLIAAVLLLRYRGGRGRTAPATCPRPTVSSQHPPPPITCEGTVTVKGCRLPGRGSTLIMRMAVSLPLGDWLAQNLAGDRLWGRLAERVRDSRPGAGCCRSQRCPALRPPRQVRCKSVHGSLRGACYHESDRARRVPDYAGTRGCRSGTVAITRRPADTQNSTGLHQGGRPPSADLDGRGLDGWFPLQVTPEGTATVAYTRESTDIMVGIVSPTGTTPFCLSTTTRSLASQQVSAGSCV